MPAYLGTHSTNVLTPFASDWYPFLASHCSWRKDLPKNRTCHIITLSVLKLRYILVHLNTFKEMIDDIFFFPRVSLHQCWRIFILNTELKTAIIFFLLPEHSVVYNNNLKITHVFVIDLHTGGTVQYKINRLFLQPLLFITARIKITADTWWLLTLGSSVPLAGQGKTLQER